MTDTIVPRSPNRYGFQELSRVSAMMNPLCLEVAPQKTIYLFPFGTNFHLAEKAFSSTAVPPRPP